ncbi:hypothetical protein METBISCDRAFT_23684 [Metschnikowia bicuspidata]|uniref:Spc7 kinetochore protein domain-containing protein n=1 Tax=Metschnikowia bicuspidata TaxID=27322 RepID=A0A4P9ZB51_9ASCO|nr:hypothetical protein METBISCDRAFT_23684 [Metschnikowia bicuspidata]
MTTPPTPPRNTERPRGILKHRESTGPLHPERQVSFHGQVELRQFEFTADESIKRDDGKAGIEDFGVEEESMELTRQLVSQRRVDSEMEGREVSDDRAHEGARGLAQDREQMQEGENGNENDSEIAEKNSNGDRDNMEQEHDEDNENKGNEEDEGRKTDNDHEDNAIKEMENQEIDGESYRPKTENPTAKPLLPHKDSPRNQHLKTQNATSSRHGASHLDIDDHSNLSYSTSPLQERQVLILPNINSPATKLPASRNTPELQHFSPKPVQSQDYADSLRDYLFNDVLLPHDEVFAVDTEPTLDTESETAVHRAPFSDHNDEEVDVELTAQVPHFPAVFNEEVTMDFTTRIAREVTISDSAGFVELSHYEETMELTQPLSAGRETEKPTATFAATNMHDNVRKLQNEPETESPNEFFEAREQPSAEPSQEQEESTMELTAVQHHPRHETHSLSVVEEEDEDAHVPMELTQPVPSYNVVKTPVHGEQATPPGAIHLFNDNLAETPPTRVDTPLTSQQQLNRLIEEATPPAHASIESLGTPMPDPPQSLRASPDLPPWKEWRSGKESEKAEGKDSQRESQRTSMRTALEEMSEREPNQEQRLDQEPVEEKRQNEEHIEITQDHAQTTKSPSSRKRSLDPPVELRSSSSKRAKFVMYNSQTDLSARTVTLAQFLKDVGIKFFDDFEFANDLFSENSVDTAPAAVFSKEDYYRANTQVTLLEVYELSCKELKRKIEHGKKTYQEIQDTANEEAPEMFHRYYESSYYDQMAMKANFMIVRDYMLENAKREWYQWRTELFRNLTEELASNLEVIHYDKETIENHLSELDSELESLQRSLAELKDDLVRFRRIKEQQKLIDPAAIEAVRTEFAELNSQIFAHRKCFSVEQDRLQELNQRISERNALINRFEEDVDRAKAELATLEQPDHNDLQHLSIISEILQACAGLRFLDQDEPHVFRFKFNPKMAVTLDISRENAVEGLSLQPIDSDVQVLHNAPLEWYCPALAQATPFLNIYNTLAAFSAKWRLLVSIDEQIYALSMYYPVEFGEFQTDSIMFKLRYYSSERGLKIDFFVTIPVLKITTFQSSMTVAAKVLRGPDSITERLVKEVICRKQCTHRLFERVEAIEIW